MEIILDLNSVQFCSDSVKERLKQTMLNQELMFMGQVFELHQLHRIQAAMAEDIKRRGVNDYNSRGRGVNSSPVNLNNQQKGPMGDMQHHTPGIKQKPLDLNLPADELICQAPFDLNISLNIDEEMTNKGEKHRSLMGKRTCAPPPDIIDLEDHNSKYSKDDFDLGLPSGLAAPNSSFGGNHILQRSIITKKPHLPSLSENGTSHLSNGTASNRPFINVDRTCLRQMLCGSVFNADFIASDKSISHRGTMLDLNTTPLEDLSDWSNTYSGVVNLSATENIQSRSSFVSAVSPTPRKESHVINRAGIPDLPVQNNLTFGDKISRGGKSEDNKGKIIFIDLDSDSDEEHCSSGSDPKIESVGSSLKPSNVLSSPVEMGEAEANALGPEPICQNLLVPEQPSDEKLSNSSKSESVINIRACSIKTLQSSVDGGDSRFTSSDKLQMIDMGRQLSSPVVMGEAEAEAVGPEPICQNLLVPEQPSNEKLSNSSESESVINIRACSIKTLQSGVDGGDSNFTFSNELQMIEIVPHSGAPGRRSSESPDSKVLCFKSKDLEVEMAAKLLMQISVQQLNSMVSQRKEHNHRRQWSTDSYEEMVLNAVECGPDAYSVSSNAYNVDVSENMDSRCMLKRGTRTKKFRNVLSSLSTLSSHEILEDVNIFEVVQKSRQYRKMRGKKVADDDDWYRPTKNKRSRTSKRN